MVNIQTLRNHLEQQKGKQAQIQQSITALQQTVKESKRDLRRHELAREVIREVGLKTQQQLQYHIGDITSLALEAVFDAPYALLAEFVQRRNKTECDLYFERDGYRVDPLTASGGGTVDVATFALRVASWSMNIPRTRPVLVLDEPFKHLKGAQANLRVLEMIKQISDKLQIQIIMISDERIPREDIVANADKVFETKIQKGVTTIL